jgi:N-methylhydantoinase A
MIHLGIDIGGTFTDILLLEIRNNPTAPRIEILKVPTTTKNLEQGIIDAIARYEGISKDVALISHATTVATNALLTRAGLARCALITNHGFRDILEIGRQRRPELYNLNSRRPEPLVRRRDRFTVSCRIGFDGKEIEPLSKNQLRRIAKKIARNKFDSVAIAFLNSYANAKHEKEAARILRKEGVRAHIDLSSQVDPEYREFERTSTTVVNSTLSPLISEYLSKLRSSLQEMGFRAPLYVMNSDGSASTAEHSSKYPISMIESGPAAGVLAARELARSLSIENVITFDMGGTTAKAGAVLDYTLDVSYEFEAAGKTHSGRSIRGSGYVVRAPFIDLAEVSAGGGTIAWVDEGGLLKVGPQSAGAEPGPVAYGIGGISPTVTDANLILGRLSPQGLLGGELRLNVKLAEEVLESQISNKLKIGMKESALGIIKLANNNMAKAISIVSIERGRDPRKFTLVAFGGAGPMHACDLAEELGIPKVVIPIHPGLFSASGLLSANLERKFSIPVLKDISDLDMESYFRKLHSIAEETLRIEGDFPQFNTRESADLRYLGQSFEITIPYEKTERNLSEKFKEKYKQLYGYASSDPIEMVNARLSAIIPTGRSIFQKREISEPASVSIPKGYRDVLFSSGLVNAPVYAREGLVPGTTNLGPCIIEEYDSTSLVNPGWSWQVDSYGNIALTRGSQ